MKSFILKKNVFLKGRFVQVGRTLLILAAPCIIIHFMVFFLKMLYKKIGYLHIASGIQDDLQNHRMHLL